jgi:hypothetical protein
MGYMYQYQQVNWPQSHSFFRGIKADLWQAPRTYPLSKNPSAKPTWPARLNAQINQDVEDDLEIGTHGSRPYNWEELRHRHRK